MFIEDRFREKLILVSGDEILSSWEGRPDEIAPSAERASALAVPGVFCQGTRMVKKTETMAGNSKWESAEWWCSQVEYWVKRDTRVKIEMVMGSGTYMIGKRCNKFWLRFRRGLRSRTLKGGIQRRCEKREGIMFCLEYKSLIFFFNFFECKFAQTRLKATLVIIQ